MTEYKGQNLSNFNLPSEFRGKNPFICQLWWLVQSILFATSPQFMYGWRNFLLRIFGAEIGKNVIIRPTARVTYPWKLKIGDNSWIGDHVELYNLGNIIIGKNVVISQRSYICTGSHDASAIDFAIYALPIHVNDGAWVATDVFVAPGVTIGTNAVIGARSSVFADAQADYIHIGSPARQVKPRVFKP